MCCRWQNSRPYFRGFLEAFIMILAHAPNRHAVSEDTKIPRLDTHQKCESLAQASEPDSTPVGINKRLRFRINRDCFRSGKSIHSPYDCVLVGRVLIDDCHVAFASVWNIGQLLSRIPQPSAINTRAVFNRRHDLARIRINNDRRIVRSPESCSCFRCSRNVSLTVSGGAFRALSSSSAVPTMSPV